jgi:hypothetical protein
VPRPAVVPGNHRPGGGPEFGAAVAELALGVAAARSARPELTVDDEPPPRRLAPRAVAFAATVESEGREIGWGRFVLLHDPAGQDGWAGSFRVIAYIRADLEPDIAADPLIGEVGWSWLTEALEERSAGYAAPSGTVTRVVTDGFGAKQSEPVTTEFEMRASWSPVAPRSAAALAPPPAPSAPPAAPSAPPPAPSAPPAAPSAPPAVASGTGFYLDRHVAAWCDALCAASGLPPVQPGVAHLRPKRPGPAQ